MNLPTQKQCQELLDKYKVPKNIREHCEKVRQVALFLVNELQKKGIKIDVELVSVSTLLHDMFKMAVIKDVKPNKYHSHEFTKEELDMRKELIAKFPGMYESQISYEVFKNDFLEFAEFFKLAGDPNLEKKSWEEMLLHYSDTRVLRDDIVSLQERLDYFIDFYKEKESFWQGLSQRDNEVERKIFENLDFKPEELKDRCEQVGIVQEVNELEVNNGKNNNGGS